MKSNQKNFNAFARLSIIPASAILLAAFFATVPSVMADPDNTSYCNAVQDKIGFIRYPLGTMSVYSTHEGETADGMTRVPRIYPSLGSVVVKGSKDDWRSTITGDPSILNITYSAHKPSGQTTAAITLSPHVSVFQMTFPQTNQDKYLVIDFSEAGFFVDNWAALKRWTDRQVTWIDNQTIEASVGEPGKKHAYYFIKFSAPALRTGVIDNSRSIKPDVSSVTGSDCGVYGQFNAPSVTVAVAGSFTSLAKAKEFLSAEFTDFDTTHRQCLAAWNDILNRVEMDGPENSKRVAYTALYSILANIIGGDDGSYYSDYYAKPVSVSSSDYWEFIGGYQSCCWDNVRATYPFLTLAYPGIMTDVLGTYLARYERNGCMDGDICLFTGPSGHDSIRYVSTLLALSREAGIPADYPRLYSAIKDNFNNPKFFPPEILSVGHMTQPSSGGFACSRTLENSDGLYSLAQLANAMQDTDLAEKDAALSKCYTNLWDPTDKVFRVRATDETWGPEATHMTWNPNPAGLFEGTSEDWEFSVPHDPYGMIDLPGQEDFVARLTRYCTQDTWFNDYQEIYPYLFYYAGAPNESQKIIRDVWVPMFKAGVMYEGVRPNQPHSGWHDHYTGGSGWLLCSMLGLYPTFAPAGQYIIGSPSINKAVIHNGKNDIIIQTENNSDENIYIRSIKVDGKIYPACMIPAQRLASGATIDLEMSDDPSVRLGNLFVTSSDGFIRDAELVTDSDLKCVIEPAVADATTKIFSQTKPVKLTIDGQENNNAWSYNETDRTITVHSSGKAAIEVFLM